MVDASLTSGPSTEQHRSFCRFCSALCGILVTVEGDRVVRVVGDPEHPLSEGYTCPKGRALGAFHHDAGRLDVPLLGRAGPARRAAGWDEALDDLAARLTAVRAQHGVDAIAAFFGNAVFYDAAGFRIGRKLLNAIGSRSVYSAATVDAPSRPYVAELVTGHPLTFARSIDIEHTTLTVLIGLNPLVSHGHNSGWANPRQRMRHLLDRGEVWVIDPRRTETAKMATRHLAPRPGTDHVWLAALCNALLTDHDDLDDLRSRADGIDEVARALARFTIPFAAQVTGIEQADLEALLDRVRVHGRLAALGGTGVSMTAHANLTEWLLWVLLIVTGSIDAPGGAWVNPGFLRSLDRRRWEPSDGRAEPGPASRPELPRRLGEHPAAALADEIDAGNVRALLVLGGNPITSLPATDRFTRALDQLDVVATIDVVHTATTDRSTHVLPTAGQLERADLPAALDINYAAVATQYTKAVVPPGAARRATWHILAALGDKLGAPVTDLDVDAATDDDLLAPIAAGGRSSFDDLRMAARCIVDAPAVYGWLPGAVLPGGRYRLAPAPMLEQLERWRTDADGTGALLLVPRRQLTHLNSQLTDERGDAHRAAPWLLLHPDDAASRSIMTGDRVTVSSSSGSLTATADVNVDIAPGVVSLPHGFEGTNVNQLTAGDQLDPLTGMAAYAGVPVSVELAPAS